MRTKILLALIALLLAAGLCAAFPAGEDQPAAPTATMSAAYPPPVYAAYPPPPVMTEEPEPTEEPIPAAPDGWHYCTPGAWGCGG